MQVCYSETKRLRLMDGLTIGWLVVFKDWFVRRLSQTWTIGRSVAMLLGRDGGCSDCWMKGGIISWFFECRDG